MGYLMVFAKTPKKCLSVSHVFASWVISTCGKKTPRRSLNWSSDWENMILRKHGISGVWIILRQSQTIPIKCNPATVEYDQSNQFPTQSVPICAWIKSGYPDIGWIQWLWSLVLGTAKIDILKHNEQKTKSTLQSFQPSYLSSEHNTSTIPHLGKDWDARVDEPIGQPCQISVTSQLPFGKNKFGSHILELLCSLYCWKN